MKQKVCKECGALKWISEFYRHPHYADGHMNTCKPCKRAYAAEHRLLKAEQIRAYKRRWAARPENIAKRKAYANTPRGKEVHRMCNRLYIRWRRLMERQAV